MAVQPLGLLVFDSGDFSENETFLITNWFQHTPRDVLAKNFGVAEVAFDALPTDIGHTRYMFAADVPPALGDDAPAYPASQPPASYTWHMHSSGLDFDQCRWIRCEIVKLRESVTLT